MFHYLVVDHSVRFALTFVFSLLNLDLFIQISCVCYITVRLFREKVFVNNFLFQSGGTSVVRGKVVLKINLFFD